MEIINLTPHQLVLRDENGTDHLVPPSGMIARVSTTPGQSEKVEGVPVPIMGRDAFGEVVDLPDPKDGCLFVVSLAVASAIAGTWNDLVRPGTGPNDGAVREDGKVVAVTRLIRA